MNIKRSDVNITSLFGKDRAQEDLNLKYYFVKTKQYESIKNGEKELVLGRKGAGKSALFSILSEEAVDEEHIIPVKISFDGEDFVYIEEWLKCNNFNEPLNDDFRYSLAWKNYILDEIIYSAMPYIDFFDDNLKQRLVAEGVIEDSSWKRFANAIFKVFKGGKLKSSLGEIEFDFSSLSTLSLSDKEKIKESLSTLINNNDFFVVIDNLDEPWKNNENMNSWLRGLVFAIRQLKREYNNLKIVAFLRTDIYEVISKGSDLFDSKSEVTTIEWDDNNYYSLQQLVAARIAHYFKLEYPNTYQEINECWNLIFPPSTHYSGRNKFFPKYIIDRTFQRPRELLQFCRFLLEASKTTTLPIEQNAIYHAEIKYSSWKLIDLNGEYSKTCSNIETCINSFIGAKRTWDWSCADLIEHFNKLDDNCILKDYITKEKYTEKQCIEFLYRIGFFRKVIRETHRRTKYKMFWQDDVINFEKTVFDIHPAFRKKFTAS